jgi:hypothetical protein
MAQGIMVYSHGHTPSSYGVWKMFWIYTAEPYDAQHAIICFDESPYQFICEVRQLLLLAPGQPVGCEE